jgi:hypothetical protein
VLECELFRRQEETNKQSKTKGSHASQQSNSERLMTVIIRIIKIYLLVPATLCNHVDLRMWLILAQGGFADRIIPSCSHFQIYCNAEYHSCASAATSE